MWLRTVCPAILWFITLALAAQSAVSPAEEQSDPAADVLLSDMENFLSSHHRIDVQFELTLTYPGEEPLIYEGTFNQQANKFKIDVGAYQIMSDGLTRWVYLPDEDAVHIYNADGIDGPQTPLNYLQLYRSEDFIYAITGQEQTPDGTVQLVEFKPVDRYSDFSKLRLAISSKNHAPHSVEVFEKSGARTHLEIVSIDEAPQRTDGFFTFDMDAHPDIIVEDLRID